MTIAASVAARCLFEVQFDRLVVKPTAPGTPARDFGAYSVTFDGQALTVGETVDAAPGVRLTRRA